MNCMIVLYHQILDHMEERRAVGSAAVFTFLKTIVANPFPKPVSHTPTPITLRGR